jgi:hypothetical protein
MKIKKLLRALGLLPESNVVELTGMLSARVFRANGRVQDLGVIARKKVTTAFVNHLVDSLQNQTATPIDTFKYHDSGTGVGAESNANTALGTPCGEARDVGTQLEGASANIYKSVATHTYAGPFAITEHGLFSAAAAGTLMDRSVFAAINVVATEKIEFSYELTAQAEA